MVVRGGRRKGKEGEENKVVERNTKKRGKETGLTKQKKDESTTRTLSADPGPEYISSASIKSKYQVSYTTLRKWASDGRVACLKLPGGARRYEAAGVDRIMGLRQGNETAAGHRKRILYARVSSAKQKPDLERQKQFLRDEYPDDELVSDVGSGLNWQRPGFQRLLDLCIKGNVSEIVLSHKDRLCRFAYDLLEGLLQKFGVKLLVLHQSLQDGGDETRDRNWRKTSLPLLPTLPPKTTAAAQPVIGRKGRKRKQPPESQRKEKEKPRPRKLAKLTTKRPSKKKGTEQETAKTIKIKMVPTPDQKIAFNQWLGAARWTFNQCVATARKMMKRRGVSKVRQIRNLLKLSRLRALFKKREALNRPDRVWLTKVPEMVRDAAITDFTKAIDSNEAKEDLNGKYDIQFRAKKQLYQESFTVHNRALTWTPLRPRELKIFPSFLDEQTRVIRFTENLPSFVTETTCRLVKERGTGGLVHLRASPSSPSLSFLQAFGVPENRRKDAGC